MAFVMASSLYSSSYIKLAIVSAYMRIGSMAARQRNDLQTVEEQGAQISDHLNAAQSILRRRRPLMEGVSLRRAPRMGDGYRAMRGYRRARRHLRERLETPRLGYKGAAVLECH